jgi:hypothetical protein
MGDTERREGHKVWDMRILGQKGELVTGRWKELCDGSSTFLYPGTD